MENKSLRGIPLKIITEEIMKVSYVKILTDEGVETFKIPTHVQNYRLRHLLNPNFIISFEVVKTRKNWILKHIHNYQDIFQKAKYNYQDYLTISEIAKIILIYSKEDQKTGLLRFIENYLETKDNIDLLNFEVLVLEFLGFIPDKSKILDSRERMFMGKYSNNL
jgi:hypothetical protein